MDSGNGANAGGVVLVADDDADIRNLVAFRLEQAGYTVAKASDGEEALRMAREERPDICVLDVRMPKLNGFEVIERLRETEEARSTPVVLLTATVQDKDVARGFEVGADDYVRKPFDPRELQARVAALLRRR